MQSTGQAQAGEGRLSGQAVRLEIRVKSVRVEPSYIITGGVKLSFD